MSRPDRNDTIFDITNGDLDGAAVKAFVGHAELLADLLAAVVADHHGGFLVIPNEALGAAMADRVTNGGVAITRVLEGVRLDVHVGLVKRHNDPDYRTDPEEG